MMNRGGSTLGSGQMQKKKIYYVDDCDANLRLVEKSLSKEYDIDTLHSPSAFLDKLDAPPPDLVLLDVNMPEEDGYEVCRRLRQNDQFKDLPVVFLTCRATLEDRLRGYEVGGDAYVTKPFQLSELKSIVRSQINRHQRLVEVTDSAASSNEMIGMLMRNCSEIGAVLQYARELSQATDETGLLNTTFHFLQQFALQSTVCLKTDAGDIVARCDRHPIVSLEVNLLEMARNGPRIANAGNKYIFKEGLNNPMYFQATSVS
jgi:DNA-binding response OmpR family regulator